VSTETDILVVGAGPTGLTLALQAHAHGARVRIVERRPDLIRPSRAMIMHIRTLEVLRPLDVVEQLLAHADISPQVCLHFGSETVPVRLSDVALNDTAYPHLSLVRQMDVEAVLAQALTDRGVHVERGTELVDLNQEAVATLLTPTGIEATAPAFVVGCDGADSTVRTRAGIGWRGGGYSREVVLADVDLDGMVDKDMAHVVVGRSGLVFLFRLGEQASWRLLATRPSTSPSRPPGQDGAQVPLDQVQKLVDDAHLSARITNVSWSSAVRLRQGLAEAYRKGRVFLAGDAGHVHSPAGGQGMNTGIQDAARRDPRRRAHLFRPRRRAGRLRSRPQAGRPGRDHHDTPAHPGRPRPATRWCGPCATSDSARPDTSRRSGGRSR
jgi:2-polyprenyl-6-methoxyphenol hydroxylase-like FAD-dependent oxidoreductase